MKYPRQGGGKLYVLGDDEVDRPTHHECVGDHTQDHQRTICPALASRKNVLAANDSMFVLLSIGRTSWKNASTRDNMSALKVSSKVSPAGINTGDKYVVKSEATGVYWRSSAVCEALHVGFLKAGLYLPTKPPFCPRGAKGIRSLNQAHSGRVCRLRQVLIGC